MTAGPSVTVHYAQAMIQDAKRHGIALPAELIAEISSADRIPLERQDQLWDAYRTGSDDQLAGLRLGSRIQIGHLDSVGMLLVTCETLGEAYDELTAYAPVIGEGGFSLEPVPGTDGEQVVLAFDLSATIRRVDRIEAAVATLLHLTRWATGDAVRPDAVWFTHAPQASREEYTEILEVPVRFGADHHGVVLATEQLRLPLVQANEALHEHLRGLVDRTMARLAEADLGARVSAVVRENPAWGRDRVADHLAFSGRHLNRLLAESGVSFKTIRDGTLHGLAVRRLEQGARVSDVAAELGYSDETTFTRAFRRWEGTTPGQFRGARDLWPKTQS